MFEVSYIITCYEGEKIEQKVNWICLEQSVELPEEVVSDEILNKVKGDVAEIRPLGENKYFVRIQWPKENVGNDKTQFLNVLFGNISLGKGIKIQSVNWEQLSDVFSGPAFGIERIREDLKIWDRAMSCAVLKPMGLSAEELARQAYELALGGIDLIKDDHGIANQSYAPLRERVEAISEALQRAENKYGMKTAYFPNITASGSKLKESYELVYDLGADGIMVLPHLCGYEVMHELAEHPFELPIIAHPAFSGALVSDPDHGFTPAFLYGEVFRAFGTDFIVYPNTGGRFSFSLEECHQINEAARTPDSPFKTSFPMPGGGVKRDELAIWIAEYGNDTVFLMGSSLFRHPKGLRKAAEEVSAYLRKD